MEKKHGNVKGTWAYIGARSAVYSIINTWALCNSVETSWIPIYELHAYMGPLQRGPG